MVRLEKQDFLVRRDEQGNFVPVEVELEDGSGTVMLVPFSRGELLKLQSTGKADLIDSDEKGELAAELLSNHLVEPKLSKQELMEDVQPLRFGQLMRALFQVSGYDPSKKNPLWRHTK